MRIFTKDTADEHKYAHAGRRGQEGEGVVREVDDEVVSEVSSVNRMCAIRI